MGNITLPVQRKGDALYLRLYLQPRASQNRFIGLHGDELKVAITAPPVDGKANAHLLKWLARQCRVARTQVQLVTGESSRHKKVMITSPKELPAELAELLAKST